MKQVATCFFLSPIKHTNTQSLFNSLDFREKISSV